MAEVFVEKVDIRNRTRIATACIECGKLRMLRTDAITKRCKKCSCKINGSLAKPIFTGSNANCVRCGAVFWKYKYRDQKFCSAYCGNESRKSSREDKRKKINARSLANVALSRGIIKRLACIKCGELKAEMHHEDYDKPLEVIWLCFRHHTELHAKRGDFKAKVNR